MYGWLLHAAVGPRAGNFRLFIKDICNDNESSVDRNIINEEHIWGVDILSVFIYFLSRLKRRSSGVYAEMEEPVTHEWSSWLFTLRPLFEEGEEEEKGDASLWLVMRCSYLDMLHENIASVPAIADSFIQLFMT